MIALGIKTPMH